MPEQIDIDRLMESLSVLKINKPEISVELTPWEEILSSLTEKERDQIHSTALKYRKDIINDKIIPGEVKFLGKDIGYGLFAREEVKKGTFIGEYTGIVRPLSRSWFLFNRKHYPTDYAWDFPGLSKKGKPLEIDSRQKGNETRFINHSFEPNLQHHFTIIEDPETKQLRGAVFFTASRKISAGDQLLVNYGEDYWVGGKRELVML